MTVVNGLGTGLKAQYSDWTSFTPTGSWNTNTTYTGFVRQVGDTIEVQVEVALTGAPDAVALTIDPPSGFTIDESKIVADDLPVGYFWASDTGTSSRGVGLCMYSTTNNNIRCFITTTAPSTMTTVSSTVPFSFGNTDFLNFYFYLPTSTGSNTSSTVYGCGASGVTYIPWTSFTPTGVWTSNVDYTGLYRQVGDTLEVQVRVVCSGAPSAGTLAIAVPSGFTIDASKLFNSGRTPAGLGSSLDTGVSERGMYVVRCTNPAGSPTPFDPLVTTANPNSITGITPTSPFTYGSSDLVDLFFICPVSAGPSVSSVTGCGSQLSFEPWHDYTPTGTWTSNVTYTGKVRRLGDVVYKQILLTCTGAPGPATAILFDNPTEYVYNVNNALGNGAGAAGYGLAFDQSATSTRGPLQAKFNSVNNGRDNVRVVTVAPNTQGGPIPTVPFSFAINDQIRFSSWEPVK